MADRIAEAFVEIRARLDKLDGDLRGAQNRVRRQGSRLGDIFSTAMGTAIGVGIQQAIAGALRAATRLVQTFARAAVRLLRASFGAFQVQEAAEVALRGALRAGGDTAVEANLEALKAYASEIQRVTTYGDEQVLTIMAQARALGVNTNQLGAAAKATIGLAEALNTNVESATRYIALALQGETEVLQRYIPALKTATTQQERFAAVIEFTSAGWKVAQENATSTTGRIQQFKNAVGDLMELLGSIVGAAGGGGSGLLPRITNALMDLNNLLQHNASVIRGRLAEAWEWLTKQIDAALERITRLLDAFEINDPFARLTTGLQLAFQMAFEEIEVAWVRLKTRLMNDAASLDVGGVPLFGAAGMLEARRRSNNLEGDIARIRAEGAAARAGILSAGQGRSNANINRRAQELAAVVQRMFLTIFTFRPRGFLGLPQIQNIEDLVQQVAGPSAAAKGNAGAKVERSPLVQAISTALGEFRFGQRDQVERELEEQTRTLQGIHDLASIIAGSHIVQDGAFR